jgi:hypothetical protein
MKQESKGAAYCKVCLLQHDEETHEATLAVRKWHRWEVIKGFAEVREEAARIQEMNEPRVA